MEMDKDAIIQGLMGLLILILSGLFTWSLVRINDLNDRDATMDTQLALIQQTLDTIAVNTDDIVEGDSSKDISQDEQIKKFWKITSTHRDWINTLRVREGLDIQSWPPLD